MTALTERFWAKVDKTPDCWVWTGAKSRAGYGQIGINGRAQYAHRVVFMINGAQDIADSAVDHICFNRACVRPDHLRLVTSKQNNEHRRGPNRNSTSGVRGVFYCNTFHKWFGTVTHDRKLFRKSFATKEAAGEWVARKRQELFTHDDAAQAKP